MRRILSLLVENEPGALSRIAGLFSARGYNIESLTVAPTDDDSLSRMTVVTHGSEQIIEQITKQLNKLIDVVRLMDLTEGRHIERELLLLKVAAEGAAGLVPEAMMLVLRAQADSPLPLNPAGVFLMEQRAGEQKKDVLAAAARAASPVRPSAPPRRAEVFPLEQLRVLPRRVAHVMPHQRQATRARAAVHRARGRVREAVGGVASLSD